MTSESEHTNRQRSPQQAQGRQWPILVLLLGLAALVLAPTACGGSSSTSTPDTTTGSPSTATSTPASSPTPEPTDAAEVGESAGISRETREYIETVCALQPAEKETATWGKVADQAQKTLDFIEKNEPPEELRDLLEASVAVNRLMVRFGEERRSLSVADEEAWSEYSYEDPERTEAFETYIRAQEALDDDVLDVLESSC